ncbi:DUF4230 domain-containing protein [Fontisphaera persica]|uniref:DUF4230 domain-containing protein n=1 Tax=Fontisphaera persica TaxID=2974023 RepID=UPI0024C0742E|nr:DUF4230 domain-containing protein [Fontisphaera persica]WCJ59630.1 DUF4230 domain-containing protein [Fontisphaera persica]
MWKTRFIIAGLVLVILSMFLLVAGLLMVRWYQQGQRPVPRNTAVFLRNIQTLNHLVTVEQRLEKVVVLEDPPTGKLALLAGDNRVILVAHGVVKAGVDLSQITEKDMKWRGTNLILRLPSSQITDVYLDEQRTQLIEHKTGFLRRFDAQLPELARQQALHDMRRAAREYGILAEADQRARASLQKFLEPMGISVQFGE